MSEDAASLAREIVEKLYTELRETRSKQKQKEIC